MSRTFSQRLDDQIDADIALLAQVRLPEDVREAAIRDLLEKGGLFGSPYVDAARAGYRWGGEAKVTLITLPVSEERKMEEVARDYRLPEAEAYRGALLATAFLVGRHGRSISDGEATPYRSPDDAFDDLRATSATNDERQLRGCFHLGVGLFAAESYLLMELRRQDRLAAGLRLQKQDRLRPRHWIWRLRNR